MNIPVKMHLFLTVGTLLLIPTISSADTLYLKNGMYIVVAKATEKDQQIEYWVGSTKYAISKDLVAKLLPPYTRTKKSPRPRACKMSREG